VLRSFRVANHKSIRDEQELLLMPAYDKDGTVVPVAAIYGRNAAGKSNLLDAVRFMRAAVRDSFGRWEAETGVPRVPFRLDVASLAEPSTFVVDLVLEGGQYSYGFEIDDRQVISEWLYLYRHTNRKSVIFERGDGVVQLGDSLPERVSRTRALSGALRENALLLSTAMQLGEQPEFVPVYRWFRDRLLVPRVDPQRIRSFLPRRIETAIDYPGFLELIRPADMDIADIRVEETEEPTTTSRRAEARRLEDEIRVMEAELRETSRQERRTALENMLRRLEDRRKYIAAPRFRRDIVFAQGDGGIPMTIEEQSAGTVAYIDLVAHALNTLDRGGVLLVDEMDMSLHPRLIARLIELFRDAKANPRTSQLIFNTHDATLLGTSFGKEILRRDEIWFVDKKDGATALYPLTDFHPRQEDNREKRYLGGSYGGVPAVFSDSLVESLLESRKGSVDGAP
jgi:hypothetical protein